MYEWNSYCPNCDTKHDISQIDFKVVERGESYQFECKNCHEDLKLTVIIGTGYVNKERLNERV